MCVLHLSTVHHPEDPRIAHKQLPSLVQAGFEVHFAAQGKGKAPQGVHFHPLSIVTGRYARLRLQRQVLRLVRRIRPKVVQIHDPELLPLLWWIKKRYKISAIYDMHEDYAEKGGLEGKMIRYLEKMILPRLDHTLIAESDYAYMVQDVPFTLIPNYSLEKNGKIRSLNTPVRLVFTGVLSKERGLVNVLQLAQQLSIQKVEASVTVIGKCNIATDLAEAKTFVSKFSNLPLKMDLDAYKSTEALDTVLENAHFGIILFNWHPTQLGTKGTLPTKFYEYLAAGLPIVCSDFPRWKHFVEHHEVGFTCAPNQIDELIERLRFLQSNPSAYERLSENALRLSKQFMWETVAEDYVSVYRQIQKNSAET